jgi:uncharacterized membrane protein
MPGVVTILLVPGATLMSLLDFRPATTASRVVLAVCLSLMVIMVVGGVASQLGPHVGLAHPLNPLPQRVIWASLSVIGVVTCIALRREPASWIFEGVDSEHVAGLLVSGSLVVVSILGVARLNHIGSSKLAVYSTALDVAVLLIGIIGGWRRTSRWPLGTLLYAATLSILLSTSLRGGHLYGWDIQKEFGIASHTLRAGVWVIPTNHDAYASMLSLTVLPTILHSLLKLRLAAFFELIVPAILALLPLAVYSTVSRVPRWLDDERPNPRPGLALGVVTAFIVSSAVFPVELGSIGRQAMALTMLAALVMVLFDRTIPVRRARIAIGLLIVTIAFTHYSTSYLLAAILLIAWLVGLLWTKGWIIASKSDRPLHRSEAKSRKILNATLVALALVAALGWNLGITRNNALSAPSGALVTSGVGLASSTGSSVIGAQHLEHLLEREFHKTAKWIAPVPGSGKVHLVSARAPASPGVAPNLEVWWNRLNFLAHESVWFIAVLGLLYGAFYLKRHKTKQFSSDLAGLAVAGLIVGSALRFSATLANFYNPERGAIVAAILLAAPITIFFDDIAARVRRVSLFIGVVSVSILALSATGLGTLFFGGQAPSSLVAAGENDERFTVSTPELASAIWLRSNLSSKDLVQSDRYGQLVLLSELGPYSFVPEIVPPEVDRQAYIYLSTVNLIEDRSRAGVNNGRYIAIYTSNLSFFNHNFYIVYSTGVTRVYHGTK